LITSEARCLEDRPVAKVNTMWHAFHIRKHGGDLDEEIETGSARQTETSKSPPIGSPYAVGRSLS